MSYSVYKGLLRFLNVVLENKLPPEDNHKLESRGCGDEFAPLPSTIQIFVMEFKSSLSKLKERNLFQLTSGWHGKSIGSL
jgi:hypothetical protein